MNTEQEQRRNLGMLMVLMSGKEADTKPAREPYRAIPWTQLEETEQHRRLVEKVRQAWDRTWGKPQR